MSPIAKAERPISTRSLIDKEVESSYKCKGVYYEPFRNSKVEFCSLGTKRKVKEKKSIYYVKLRNSVY